MSICREDVAMMNGGASDTPLASQYWKKLLGQIDMLFARRIPSLRRVVRVIMVLKYNIISVCNHLR